jgi:RNA polymerase sigma-70 factor (ECF subfamily)
VSFEDAFAALFAERSVPLYGYLSRLSGDPELAEDLVQECFVRLYQRRALPDDAAAWLVTVAHNLLRDDHRRGVRRGRLLLERTAEVPAGEPPAPADAATLATERIEAVRRALAQLPLRDRQLLLLRHEGYGYREIADLLQLTPSGIGTMLARATDAFRKAFHDLYGAST